jgi:hypothetical protein
VPDRVVDVIAERVAALIAIEERRKDAAGSAAAMKSGFRCSAARISSPIWRATGESSGAAGCLGLRGLMTRRHAAVDPGGRVEPLPDARDFVGVSTSGICRSMMGSVQNLKPAVSDAERPRRE